MNRTRMLPLAALAVACAASPLQAQLAAGVTLNFDANDPASGIDGNNWDSLTADASKNFDFAGDVTLESVSTGLSGISKAFRFTGGAADANNGTWDGQYGDGTATTWELWVKPDDTGGAGQTLTESGGAGTGHMIWYEPGTVSDGSGTINFTIDGGNGAQIQTVSAVINTSEFRHITCVYEVDAGGGTIDKMEIWVDGVLVDDNLSATVADDASNDDDNLDIPDWSGADGSGLGNVNNSSPETTTAGPFVGDIAIFRVWGGNALSPAEILANYQLLSGPDTTPPTLTGTDPVDEASGIYPGVALTATFSEDVALTGGGIITITDTTDGTGSFTIDLSALPDPDADVSVSGTDLTITPTANLELGTAYEVTIDGSSIQDTATSPNAFAGTASGDWNFSTAPVDGTPPVFTLLDPADDTLDAAGGQPLSITFDEPVLFDNLADTITLKNLTQATDLVILASDASQVSLSGNTLTITPAGGLTFGDSYAVRIGSTVLKNFNELNFGGISDDTTWNFTASFTDGSWIVDAAGNWSDSGNWLDGKVADGVDGTASFNLNFGADRIVTVDGDRSIGNITRDQPTSNRRLTLNGDGSSTLTFDVSSGSPTLTNNDSSFAGSYLRIALPIAGADGLTKAGPGLVEITNASTNFSGDTFVNQGMLSFAAIPDANIGGGSGRNITVADGAAIQRSWPSMTNAFLNRLVETSDEIGIFLTATGGSLNGNDLDFSSSAGANLPNAFLSTWASNGSKSQYNGVLTPASDAYRLGHPLQGGSLHINPALPDVGGTPRGLIIGGGAVILGGENTFTGDTVIRGGRMFLGKQLALQNSALNVGNGAGDGITGQICFLNSGGGGLPGIEVTDQPTLGGLIGARNLASIYNSANQNNTARLAIGSVLGLTLDVDAGKTHTYAGNARLSSTMFLNKTGDGTQILSGANDFTGAITISGGTLQIDGDSSAATGAVAVNGPGVLGGTGTLGGTVTLDATGGLAPGASAGTLSVGGDLDLSAVAGGGGGTLAFELDALAGSSDQIAVTGTLTIGAGALRFTDFAFSDLGGLEVGTYTLITSGTLSGTVDAANASGTIGSLSGTLQVSGNDLQLEVTAGGGTPYETWATGGELFGDDANGDGVSNGVAFLLGAAGPNANALGLLPGATNSSGDLVLSFSMLNAANRGPATLAVQDSNDLGATDAWVSALVPEGPGTGIVVGVVSFDVTANGILNDVVATIPASEAAGGKLFGRLEATE